MQPLENQLQRPGGYAAALAVTAAVVTIRWLLDGMLGEQSPYVTMVAAVAAVAWFGRVGPMVLAIMLGGLAANWMFVSPRHRLGVSSVSEGLEFGLYLLASGATAALGIALTRSRKRAEENGQRFQAAYEHAAVGMEQVSLADGRLLEVNAKQCEILGYSREEMLGRTFEQITHEADLLRERELVRRLVAGEIPSYTLEKRYIRKDGRPVNVRVTSSLAGKGASYRITIVEDITERKQAQEALAESQRRLAGIVESAMDAIITIDEQQRIVLFNAAAERTFGLTAAEAVGSSIERLIPQQFRGAHAEHVRQFGQTGQTNRAMGRLCTVLGLRANGEEFPIEASISQVNVGGQKLCSVILRDVTQRLAAEEQVRQLNAELERRVEQRTAELEAANKELEAFSYSVSHDLRAPLRHVSSFVHLLNAEARDKVGESGQRYLQVIADAAGRMGNLIDDLLTFSRIGRSAMTETEVDLGQLVEEAKGELSPEWSGRSIEWHIGALPVVRGDRTLLRSVMVNLLSNAIKYTRRREQARIEVGASEEPGEAVVSVRDNGAGFDMRFVEKLFGVFQRLHRSEDFEGTGIGLASVRRIIARHGGRTWAEGEVGRGATFYFSLPVPRNRTCQT